MNIKTPVRIVEMALATKGSWVRIVWGEKWTATIPVPDDFAKAVIQAWAEDDCVHAELSLDLGLSLQLTMQEVPANMSASEGVGDADCG